MKRNGFSLIELIAVIGLMGILAAVGTASFRTWESKHQVEKQVKEMYADLNSIRIAAMHENRSHFLTGGANRVEAYRDTDPAPDGNGALTVGSDTPVCMWTRGFHDAEDANCPGGGLSYKNLTYGSSWSGGGNTIQFTARGLATLDSLGTICVFSTVNPSYDCIKISRTRIIMGKIINQGGACGEANCQEKR
jgi:prepilin-type N-terminal cleavage/methylation domain-containing protein